jgi:glycosyltransferase involved in cell wall biosynthesis
MRILNLAREFPHFPGGHGGNTRAYCLLRALSERHRFTVVTNVYSRAQENAADDLRRYVERLEYYRDPAVDEDATEFSAGSLESVRSSAADMPPIRRPLSWRTWITRLQQLTAAAVDRLRALPTEVRTCEISFDNIRPALQRALRAGPYEVLQIEYTENAGWVRRLPFRGTKILVVHDVKSVVWWRRFRNASNWLERMRALSEAVRFYLFERRYSRYFDHLVAMSEADREHLRRLTGHPSISVVPNGVDTGYYRSLADPSDEMRIVFAATMNHPPNRDGILWFARDVWPLIRAAEPEACLDVVGSHPTDDVRALEGNGVHVTGFVPDTRPYIAAARVFICPLRFASGTRLKVLEAMAMERPVVSTSVGAEGIDCRPGHDILLADEPREFADHVVRLLREPDEAARIAAAGRQVAQRYDWQVVAEPLDALYRDAQRSLVAKRSARPPRIGLNALFLVPGGATGGLEPYFHHLAEQLTRLDRESEYVLIASSANALEFSRLTRENLRCHVVDTSPLSMGARNALRRAAVTLFGRHWSGETEDGAAELDLDLIHCFPGYIDQFAWNVPAILTVADVQHEYHPEFFDQEELEARRALFRPSIERALHIIAISDFTRRTILERYDVEPDKISVIHLGADARFFAPVAPSRIEQVRQKHGLPENHCIYPANLWAHKNHPRLLDALHSIPAARRPHLVLTGAQTRLHTPLRKSVEERGLAANVSWLGFVDGEDLPALFAGARLMVFPSLFEGFGLPVVEAMAAQCPVACADTTSLPEIAGDAALFFDPTAVDSIAAALERLWNDAPLRDRLRAAGTARAKQFSWQRTALQTLQLYRRTVRRLRADLVEEEAAA